MKKIKIMCLFILVFLGGISYVSAETIQSRIDAASGSVTIELDDNYTENIKVSGNKNVILDLKGYILSGNVEVDTGSLTVNDSTNKGKIVSKNNIPVSNGKFTLNGGNIETSNYGIYGKDDSLITINGGSIKTGDYACLGSNNTTGDATFTINGGTLTSNWQTVYIANPVGLTITGGTLNGGIAMRMGKLNISGGVINATIANASEFDNIKDYYSLGDGYAWTPDAIHVMGGTYSTNSSKGNDLEINITGGTIKVANGLGSAVVIYDIGRVEQNITVNISSDAELLTDATSRNAFDVLNLSDIGVTSPKTGYGVYTGNVKTNIKGGVYSDEPAEEQIPEGYSAYQVIIGDNEDKYVVVKEDELEVVVIGDFAEKEDLETVDVDLVEKAIKDKYNLASFYEIAAVVATPNEDIVDIVEETTEPVEITIDLPTSLPAIKDGYVRKYYIVRVHNGETTIIDDVKDNGDGTLSFNSDKFSTYALAYNDVVKTTSSPNTFDGIGIYMISFIVSIALIIIGGKRLNKRFN